MGRRLQRLREPDALGTIRRSASAAVDGVWAPLVKRAQHVRPVPFGADDEPRIALVTVNFSTTQYLKLMLATLADQTGLELVTRVVVVDNGSRDDGVPFLRELDRRVDRVALVERHRFPTHAHGMRAGVAALRRVEHDRPAAARANFLLFCDTDLVWRNPDALVDLMGAVLATDAVLAGEFRPGPNAAPSIHASLFLVRRDAYDDPRTPPPADHGSPAYRLQRSLIDRGLPVVNFPTNRGGYVLHRGRSGAAAAVALHPDHNYGHVETTSPHYMGLLDGSEIWAATEEAYADLVGDEAALLERLVARLPG